MSEPHKKLTPKCVEGAVGQILGLWKAARATASRARVLDADGFKLHCGERLRRRGATGQGGESERVDREEGERARSRNARLDEQAGNEEGEVERGEVGEEAKA